MISLISFLSFLLNLIENRLYGGCSILSFAFTFGLFAEVFVADAPLSYGDPHFDLGKYVVKAGETGRAFHLEKGDVISVTTDLVAGAKVGDNLTIGDKGLGFKKAADGKGIAMLIGQEAHGIDGDVFVIAIR